MKQFTELNSWKLLKQHAESSHLSFNKDSLLEPPIDNAQFKLQTSHITLDFSHQKIDKTVFELLIQLANERNLKEKINALISGQKVNQSEQRPALHTALRSINSQPVFVDGNDITHEILATREKMWSISSKIRAGLWLGYTGKPIVSIVNIGIGGSDLGPRFCVNALSEFSSNDLSYHFVSDIDPNSFENAIATLNPETTLFIISSKSFTTQETIYNANKALAWIGSPKYYKKHFIAVTANAQHANKFGIENVLPIWEWVGGRYSLCSAINLITCIAVGYERFSELLAGANSMDRHFHHRELHENMPVIMALTGLWNINFLHIHSLLMLVYAKQLEQFIPYIQQMDMESNGKSIDMQGQRVNYSTGPIVWGGPGNQAQHSYYQLLCQGTHKVAADFITTNTYENDTINSFCNAKIRILSQGVHEPDLNAHIRGGMPINHISLSSCSPFSLGELIALYEHKIYIQGVLWNINSFDQPGVESAKRFNHRLDVAMATPLS